MRLTVTEMGSPLAVSLRHKLATVQNVRDALATDLHARRPSVGDLSPPFEGMDTG